MARITVAHLIIDDHVADHMWERHGISDEQVRVLSTRRYVIRNYGHAPYRMIGRVDQGRCIAVPIAPTNDWLTWVVASAWYCDQDEVTRLDRQKVQWSPCSTQDQ